jgi:hypothetical protein
LVPPDFALAGAIKQTKLLLQPAAQCAIGSPERRPKVARVDGRLNVVL